MSSLKERVNFSRIRYANCWEDAQLLLESLQVKPDDRILFIASAGDNALAALSRSPASVRAVDLSQPQLYLCALKQAAFACLEYDELLLLLGVRGSSGAERWSLYSKVRMQLSGDAQNYWNARRTVIEDGVIGSGKFERYFELFRKWLLPLVHSRASVHQLLDAKTDDEQAAYFASRWNTLRWRMLMEFFFSKAVMGRYGRDPQFLKHVSLNVPQYIRAKAEGHLQLAAATQNPFLRFIFTGAFGRQLPVYLQEQAFDAIKQNIGRLHIAEEDMDTAVMHGPFDIYCASNIFEYMSADTFKNLVHRWSDAMQPGARIAFWNLMAPRSFAEIMPERWRQIASAPVTDNGFFYARFLLEERL